MISKSKLFVFVVFSILLFSGCATENPKKTESADAIYKKAMDEYKRRKYSDAIASFYRLKYDYPAEAASVLADLRIADAHFHNKDYNEAITSYEDFRKLHPTSPYVDYVTYQLGLCHYNQILTIDRDQKHTQMALNEFYYLLTHYPSSPYAKPSYEKFLECQKKIVDHEAYVANFYYKKGKYRAAINRFESAVTNYPSIPLKDDMLYIFADSYMKVGEHEKAKGVYEFLIKQYPDSKYAKKARDIIVKRIETGPKIPQKPVAEDSEIDKGPPLTPGKEETQEDRQGLQEVKGIGEDALSVGSEAFSEPVSWVSSPSINSRGTIQKDENWDK
ncbi:MAG: outer membrane protein assembly factor BamD, partial [Candidatus Bathyarchaeia archaeon]